MTITEQIREFQNDPLSILFTRTWKLSWGELRWSGGLLQTRRTGEKYFTFPVPADEFLEGAK